VATGVDHATYQARRLLADHGFTPVPGTADLAYTRNHDGESVFLHARQTVAALRGIGLTVSADPAFDYIEHPGAPRSPSAVAAGENTLTASAPPAGRHDVAIGKHPQFGIIATNPRHDLMVAAQLDSMGFVEVEEGLRALRAPEQDGSTRATQAVLDLRQSGLRIAADLDFEPLLADPSEYIPTDPFAAALTKALDPARAARPQAPATTTSAPATAPRPAPDPVQAPTPAEEPRPEPGQQRPRTSERRPARLSNTASLAALLANRSATLAALKRLLDSVDQQIRDHPETVDVAKVTAALGQATTALGGVSKDLAAISAQVGPTAAVRKPVNPRAQAALATSTRLQRTSTSIALDLDAAPAPVDPRIAFAHHR